MVKAIQMKSECRKYIVKAVGVKHGTITYADKHGAGTRLRDEAHVFWMYDEAMRVAKEIQICVRERATVSLEEVTS